MILSAMMRFTFLVTISLATIVNITVDLVGEFASMFNLM